MLRVSDGSARATEVRIAKRKDGVDTMRHAAQIAATKNPDLWPHTTQDPNSLFARSERGRAIMRLGARRAGEFAVAFSLLAAA